jgi:hypothetical protein
VTVFVWTELLRDVASAHLTITTCVCYVICDRTFFAISVWYANCRSTLSFAFWYSRPASVVLLICISLAAEQLCVRSSAVRAGSLVQVSVLTMRASA